MCLGEMKTMGSCITKNFESYVNEWGIDCLTDYMKRRRLILKLSEDITTSNDPQSHCNTLVNQTLIYHRKKICEYEGKCQTDHHNSLYVATKLCYMCNLRNTKTVCNVLNEIFECENDFSRLMQSILSKNTCRQKHVDPKEADRRTIAYFLHHTTKGKQLFPQFVNGNGFHELKYVRLADVVMNRSFTPVNYAVWNGKFKVLLLLLKYGANLNSRTFPPGIYPIIVYLIVSLAARIEENETESETFDQENKIKFRHSPVRTDLVVKGRRKIRYPRSALLCLNYLFRTVPGINAKVCENKKDQSQNALVDILVPKLIEDNVIPLSRFREPAPLQHLCRCIIRKSLYDCWQLPCGINHLQLSTQLKQYLNLKEKKRN